MKHLVLLVFALSMMMQANAQFVIKGTVTSSGDGLPLPGINVIIKGTTTGTQTDFDGNYTITAKAVDILVFSSVGMKTKEVTVGKATVINVVLEESATLEEVVVIGYGTSVKDSRSSGIKIRGMSSAVSESKSSVSYSGTKSTLGGRQAEPQSGQLTAGELNDIEKWDEWLKALKSNDYKMLQTNWGFYLENKVEVSIKDENKKAVSNIKVTLYNDQNQLVMSALTDALGKAVLYKDLNSKCKSEYHTVQAYQNGEVFGKKVTSHKVVDFQLQPENVQNNLDVMFTIDATGSMGDEMEYLKSELKNIITRLDKSIEKKRVALTFYRDTGDEYVVRDFDFDTNIDAVKENLSRQVASGGGDYEEAVERALMVSMSKSWHTDSKTKLLFLLLDAPPHYTQENVEIIKQQIKMAQEKGIKIIPIVASGANKNVEFLMRFFSVSTNGTYVFLTDDSGIGNPHIKPTTDDYKVEKLNDLIVRLIEKYSGINS